MSVKRSTHSVCKLLGAGLASFGIAFPTFKNHDTSAVITPISFRKGWKKCNEIERRLERGRRRDAVPNLNQPKQKKNVPEKRKGIKIDDVVKNRFSTEKQQWKGMDMLSVDTGNSALNAFCHGLSVFNSGFEEPFLTNQWRKLWDGWLYCHQ